MAENAQNHNADMIDPTASNNSLSKGDTHSTNDPTQDSAVEVGTENSEGTIEVGKLEQAKSAQPNQRHSPKRDAA